MWTGPYGSNHRPLICIRCAAGPRQRMVARVVLEQFFLPGTWEASHVEELCTIDRYRCVRPDHIIPETKKQNMARRWGKPVPAAVDWPRQPGPAPLWMPSDDPDIYAPGIVSESCPF